jgi:hypothetical protein
LNLNFLNIQTQQFFDSEFFQIPETSGFFVLIFFQNPQNKKVLQKSNICLTLIKTSVSVNSCIYDVYIL